MNHRRRPAARHERENSDDSELSNAVLRLTTQWELKKAREEQALRDKITRYQEDNVELRETIEELKQELAEAKVGTSEALVKCGVVEAEAADAKRSLAKKCNPKKNPSCCRAPPPAPPPAPENSSFPAPAAHRALACPQATRNRGVRSW